MGDEVTSLHPGSISVQTHLSVHMQIRYLYILYNTHNSAAMAVSVNKM